MLVQMFETISRYLHLEGRDDGVEVAKSEDHEPIVESEEFMRRSLSA